MSDADTYSALIESLNKNHGWNLGAAAYDDYAAFLERSGITDTTTQERVLFYYHADHVLVKALGDNTNPNYAESIDYIRQRSFAIIYKHSFHWRKDRSVSEEDIFQSALLKMYEKLHLFGYRSSFMTWFTVLILNESRQLHRKLTTQARDAELEPLEDHTYLPTAQESVVDLAINNVSLLEFEKILAEHPDQRLRIVFQMYVHEDATLKEIGECLCLTTSRIHSLLEIVRRLLRKYLDPGAGCD